MKRNFLKPVHFTFVMVLPVVFIISACSTNYLTLSVTEPAPVYIPAEVKNVGIFDRSVPNTKESTTMDDIDKLLSAEGKNLDKNGAKAAIEGLEGRLAAEERFDAIKLIEAPFVESQGETVYPAAISGESVDQICRENDIGVLFVLSFYDTDSRVEYEMVPVSVNIPLAGEVKAMEHQATIYTLIKMGWRIYDSTSKEILDEFVQNTDHVSSGRGINPLTAVNTIKGRDQGVKQLSGDLGQDYGSRVFPYRTRVRREYYTKGTNNFKIAKRRAETGDWDGAAELWEAEINNRKRKIAGRAHYNMAISSEINGHLEKAIEWASKAYTDYNDKNGRDYVRILRNRVDRIERLRMQSEGVE